MSCPDYETISMLANNCKTGGTFFQVKDQLHESIQNILSMSEIDPQNADAISNFCNVKIPEIAENIVLETNFTSEEKGVICEFFNLLVLFGINMLRKNETRAARVLSIILNPDQKIYYPSCLFFWKFYRELTQTKDIVEILNSDSATIEQYSCVSKIVYNSEKCEKLTNDCQVFVTCFFNFLNKFLMESEEDFPYNEITDIINNIINNSKLSFRNVLDQFLQIIEKYIESPRPDLKRHGFKWLNHLISDDKMTNDVVKKLPDSEIMGIIFSSIGETFSSDFIETVSLMTKKDMIDVEQLIEIFNQHE